jgi:hypothetical protein
LEKGLLIELLKILRSVRILSPTGYVLSRNKHQAVRESKYADDRFIGDSGLSLTDSLAQQLYHKHYCQPAPVLTAKPGSLEYGRSFILKLSDANTGGGTWDDGWVIRNIEKDNHVAISKDNLTIWVSHNQFSSRERSIKVGNKGYVRVGKEILGLYPGFYMALSDHRMNYRSKKHLVRIYWHIRAEGAVVLMNKLTSELNGEDVPFRFKILSRPSYFGRADAATLYVPKNYYKNSLALLANTHEKVKAFLDKSVPLFTKRLAYGIGLAEDPRDGESFGLNRCRLVAEALFRCYQKGIRSDQERLEEIARRFDEVGLNLDVPYLNPGSENSYALLNGESRHFGKK